MNDTAQPSTIKIILKGYLLVNIPTLIVILVIFIGLWLPFNINFVISIFIGLIAGWYYWAYSIKKWVQWTYYSGIDRDKIIKIGRLSMLLWFKSTVDRILNNKKENKLKPLISAIVTFIIIVIGISTFKGPNFIIVKYHYYKGFAKHKTKNLQGAIDEYTKALTYNKSNTTIYISRGSAYLDLKKYNEAISDYSEAIKHAPLDPQPFAYRGRAYYELSDTLRSLEDYNKAIALNSKFGYAYYNRGLLKYILLNDIHGGCADLRIALDLGITDAKQLLIDGGCE